jgi:peptidyl-prolyl cis-trans isomerase C
MEQVKPQISETLAQEKLRDFQEQMVKKAKVQ